MSAREDAGLPEPRRGADPARLSFPDQPRLELDQLLGQLVERAQEVLSTQGRLRALLHANRLVTSELSSTAVLQRTAEAARDLIGARTATVEPPDEPASGSTDAAGAPPGGRLDVPISARGELVAHLHLADSTRGGFTAEDRELAQALAVSAGLAVENARLYESARRRGEWLQASAAITRELLAGAASGAGALELVARSSRDVAGADVVAVLRPDDDLPQPRELRVEVLVGPADAPPRGRAVPLAGSLCGRVFAGGVPMALTDGALEEEGGPMPWPGLAVGTVLAVPLRGSGTVLGVLCAARLPARPPFSDTDVEMAASFAGQAAVAIELAEARAEQQRAVVLDERERIAADLHDTVVQRLFGVGLSLQGVLAELTDSRAAQRVQATVEDVDRTINHIRSTVFPLTTGPAPVDPRDRVLDVVAEAGPALGFEPDVRFSGLLAGTVAVDLVEDLVAVVRTGLLDVARRGRATYAAVDVVEDRDGLVVHVRDDDTEGPGELGQAAAGLLSRAQRHGGTSRVSVSAESGTSQYWWVPRR